MFRNRPAMKFCLPFILGIVAGEGGWLSSLSMIRVAILFSAVLATGIATRKLKQTTPLFMFALIFLFGCIKISFDDRFIPENNVGRFADPEKTIGLHGRVSDLPHLGSQSVRWIIDVDSVGTEIGKYSVSGAVLVSVLKNHSDTTIIPSMTYGREIFLRGELVSIATARNPGEFDAHRYYLLNNVYARLNCPSLDSMCLGKEPETNFMATYVYSVRRSVAERLEKYIGGVEAAFLKGLIIGERSQIPLEIKSAFINSGVMHILAVSGLHVAIIALILLTLFQAMRVPEKLCIVITCILLLYYILLTGGAASVSRSVVMAIIFLGGRMFERKSDMFNTLAFSAVVILLIDSKQLFQPGFQLSYGAVFSLIYLYPRIYVVRNVLPRSVRDHWLVVATVGGVAVSLAAGIGTLPFTSIYFGKISVISFLANVIIVPLSNIILAIGMATVAVSYCSSWIAGAYAECTSMLTWILLKLVDFFGNVRFAYVEARFSIPASVVFYVFVGFLSNFGNRDVRKLCIVLGLVVLNVWLYAFEVFPTASPPVRLTMLDVGQGDALFLEFPDGKNMLVDAGPRSPHTDAGERFIAPFLLYHGIDAINTIVISHPHSDHLGGVPFLLRHFAVTEVIDAGSYGFSALDDEYLHLIDSLKIRRTILRAGQLIEGYKDVRMYVLHPSGSFIPDGSGRRVNLNNQSLAIKLCYGNTALLLEGDAEREAEARMADGYGSFVKTDVLKIGHHGSITSSSAPLLTLEHPQMSLISVGWKNKFHHPSPLILQRIRQNGSIYYRTDESGAIVLESDGERWRRVDWR